MKNKWTNLIQFIKFGMVGVSNTVISYVVYLVGVYLGFHYLLANVLGFVVSIFNAFYWNNKYVFRPEKGESRTLWKSFCKTFLSYAGTGLVLSNILLFIQVDLLHWAQWLAPVLNLIVTIPLNFWLNKYWAFRKGKRA